jgi:DNA processing protein
MLGEVGTRAMSRDAEEINRYFVSELSGYSIGIASGMALGHDSVAQTAALDNEGFTVAVLACGIDVIYPRKIQVLYRRITEKGASCRNIRPERSR